MTLPPHYTKVSSSIEHFHYQPQQIEVGTCYRYTKSNFDGSGAIQIEVYVAAENLLEVVKYEPQHHAAAYVLANMNWEIFCADALESWVISADGKREQVALMTLLPEDDMCMISLNTIAGVLSDAVIVGHYPAHVYNFDFISLNFAFRHLINPEDDFSIGVMQPTFGHTSRLFLYKGKADITYRYDSDWRGVDCRKYRISGEGIDGKEGFIWVNKAAGHIENIEIPVADNPQWQEFKFELQGVSRLDQAAWKNHIESEISRL